MLGLLEIRFMVCVPMCLLRKGLLLIDGRALVCLWFFVSGTFVEMAEAADLIQRRQRSDFQCKFLEWFYSQC
ncbi:hypothetical protein RchiOBHm_Chr7g0242531 [Rosa chinensis]|uniref:Uncharacterized protein n=1 Tax=Rosa chinensis TaxID=74649 RepID=A0A2P6PIH3_ROSCH|nr:hypothetical protein RchiOBHm_Chr7g0242531 [Rosa chinensis]